jgi:hypothetical protein
LVVVEVYVRRFDGWGAWASAPLLLVPALFSVSILIPGIFDVVAEIRAGTLRRATLQYSVIAALPIVWLFIRRFFV